MRSKKHYEILVTMRKSLHEMTQCVKMSKGITAVFNQYLQLVDNLFEDLGV